MTSPSTDRRFGYNSSLAIKAPCRVATTAAITLSGEQTIDGVAVVSGDRVLVKNQSSGVDNGIYIADTSSWERAPDFDGSNDITCGTLAYITAGTVHGNAFHIVTTTGTITPGTTSIAFTELSRDLTQSLNLLGTLTVAGNSTLGGTTTVNDLQINGDVQFSETYETVGLIATFLTQRHYDMRGDNHYNGMRRSIQYRKTTGLTYDDAIDVNDGDAGGDTNPTGYPNTTAAAKALEFLARFVLTLPEQSNQYVPVIENIAEFLLSMQHKIPSTARYGGFGLAINDQSASAFNAGVCGKALLKAWEATHNPTYIQGCVDAATFLLVCQSPNATYTSLYTETPIPAVAENSGFAGFCDVIGTTDVIVITSTTWNLVAAEFLEELYQVVPTSAYHTAAIAARDYMDTGVLTGYDYFAIKNAAPSAHVSVAWPNDGSHTYADGDWHRLGDVAGTGTVGSDQIEYGLDALYNLGYTPATLLTTYQTFRDYPSSDVGSFGAAYDGAICFTGYFRLQPDAIANVAYGSYYDVQGVGTLLYFKQQLAVADFDLSLPLALLAVNRGALVDEDFDTIYSTGTGFDYYTKGTIPIANAGIALLRCI